MFYPLSYGRAYRADNTGGTWVRASHTTLPGLDQTTRERLRWRLPQACDAVRDSSA